MNEDKPDLPPHPLSHQQPTFTWDCGIIKAIQIPQVVASAGMV